MSGSRRADMFECVNCDAGIVGKKLLAAGAAAGIMV